MPTDPTAAPDRATLSLAEARDSLARTPDRLAALVGDLPPGLLHVTEGPDSWSPLRVVKHLIEAERVAWIPRLELALTSREPARFAPFDRFADNTGPDDGPDTLLPQFAARRRESLAAFDRLGLDDAKLRTQAIHPDLGPVTVAQLIATWVTHDWAHLAQITRTVARSQTDAVGPWRKYFTILAG
jgi:uncharacterized damage-inducible protein DinB